MIVSKQTIEQAHVLIEQLESGDEEGARESLEDLSKLRETALFQELGKLTRELHDTLANFRLDSRLTSLTEQDIPDAQERLNYVITMTEQAANKTLTAVEAAIPTSSAIQSRSSELQARWERFRSRDMDVDEFREMARELDEFFPQLNDDSQVLQSQLSDILMAQDFQDLTGQIIRRVITLVQDVEESLVDLIRISGRASAKVNGSEVKQPVAEEAADITAEGPKVPNVGAAPVVSGQDEVDELLSSLGF